MTSRATDRTARPAIHTLADAIAPFAVGRRDRSAAAANEGVVSAALISAAQAALGGAQSPDVQALLAWLADEPAPGGASIWGTGHWAMPSLAALVNGTAARAHRWPSDQPTHPGVVLLPALVARASVAPTDVHTVVEAFNVGRAVLLTVSEHLVAGSEAGSRRPPLAGRLAATAAVARVAGLDVDQTRCALVTAATWGTANAAHSNGMIHPLDAGLAARDAIITVGLAEHGFAGPDLAADGRTVDNATPDDLMERLAHWEVAWVEDRQDGPTSEVANSEGETEDDPHLLRRSEIRAVWHSGDLTQLQRVLA